MNLLTELQYFPSVNLYKNLNKFSNIVFEQYEHYQKMSFRNRCRIAGAEGAIDLSIPLVAGRDQKTLIKDVRIAGDQPWQDQHWKTLVSCYNRSPWFEFYRDDLERWYRKPFDFLLDWDLACFEWSLKVLGILIPVTLTESFQKTYEEEENWVDRRGKILPKNRGMLASPDREKDPTIPNYRQVFEERTGFLPGLSILDLLFCEGKRAGAFLVTPTGGSSPGSPGLF